MSSKVSIQENKEPSANGISTQNDMPEKEITHNDLEKDRSFSFNLTSFRGDSRFDAVDFERDVMERIHSGRDLPTIEFSERDLDSRFSSCSSFSSNSSGSTSSSKSSTAWEWNIRTTTIASWMMWGGMMFCRLWTLPFLLFMSYLFLEVSMARTDKTEALFEIFSGMACFTLALMQVSSMVVLFMILDPRENIKKTRQKNIAPLVRETLKAKGKKMQDGIEDETKIKKISFFYKVRLNMQALSAIARSFFTRYQVVAVTIRLLTALPIRTYSAAVTSTELSDTGLLSLYCSLVSLNYFITPLLLTSGSIFVRERVGVFLDALFDVTFALFFRLAFLFLNPYARFSSPTFAQNMQWDNLIDFLSFKQTMELDSVFKMLAFLYPFIFYHIAFDETAALMEEDFSLIKEAQKKSLEKELVKTHADPDGIKPINDQVSREASDLNSKTLVAIENDEKKKSNRNFDSMRSSISINFSAVRRRDIHRYSSIFIQSTAIPLIFSQKYLRIILKPPSSKDQHKNLTRVAKLFSFFMGIIFSIFVLFAVIRESPCNSDCIRPLTYIHDPSDTCHCLLWRMNCQKNNLTSVDEVNKYIEFLSPDLMGLMIHQCSVISDIPLSMKTRTKLRLIEFRETGLVHLNVSIPKVYDDLRALRIVDAPNMNDFPLTLLEKIPQSLIYIEISGTNISTLPQKNNFYSTTTWPFLKRFVFERNKFYKLPKRYRDETIRVEYISMDGNQVNDIERGKLSGDFLQELHWASNGVEILDEWMITGLQSLKRIYLNHNLIQNVSQPMLNWLLRMEVASLTNNPICEDESNKSLTASQKQKLCVPLCAPGCIDVIHRNNFMCDKQCNVESCGFDDYSCQRDGLD